MNIKEIKIYQEQHMARCMNIALSNIYKRKFYEEIKSWGHVSKTKTKYLAKGCFHVCTGIYHIHMAYVYK